MCVFSVWKNPDLESGIRVNSLLLKLNIKSLCVLDYFHNNIIRYLLAFYESKSSPSDLSVEWVRKELCRLEANSAFPLASALPSLTFCFLTPTPVWDMIEWLRACVCVSVYPVLLLMWMHRGAGWAVLKAAVSVWAGEQWRVSVITPGTRGEGGRVFIWRD